MKTTATFFSRLHRSAFVACLGLMSSFVVFSANPGIVRTALGDNEETFIYAGKCFNGEPYRLLSYQKNIAGLSQSHYDFDGPVGQGTVLSEVPPKVMAARVCRKFAEIVNAKYWE